MTLVDGLSGDFTSLAVAVGVTDTDGLFTRAAINAYGLMGLDPTNPATTLNTQQTLDAPWIAEYYALRSIARNAASLFDKATADQKASKSQIAKNIDVLLMQAQAAVEARGYALSAGFGYGLLNIDYIEPFYSPGISNWRA